MISREMLEPKSIVVVGASNELAKPGGKVLKNLVDAGFKGPIYAVNPKEKEVQGITCHASVADLPQVDMAIIAIAAKFCLETVTILADQKGTKGFIILSAGFSEESAAGRELEKAIVKKIESVGGSLVGPNCIGVLTTHYAGVFTTPIPRLDPLGCDFASGSGATAVFIMEAGMPKGLSFSSIWSVGNSAQLGVEEVLAHFDESFDPKTSSRVKLLYIEDVKKPAMLLKHARSLIRKGCRIAAIKSGSSEAGSRAASSHTGALASPDAAVSALFRKAGIVRCAGREELVAVASVFMHRELQGRNIAIITHAGGPAVMLTDSLSNNGLEVPHLEGDAAKELLAKLHPGSSVANPIDFLATGSAQQLGEIIDACEHKFKEIDGMVVIFGSPGLFPVYDAYRVLDEKMRTCKKPIFPVLPSIINAADEVAEFLSKGRINFPDEVVLGNAIAKTLNTARPAPEKVDLPKMDTAKIRAVIDEAKEGYLDPAGVQSLLDAAGISRAGEAVVAKKVDAVAAAKKLGYPVVMKVVGPVHKSDVGGVVLGVKDDATVEKEFDRMMKIKETTAVLLQPMLSGIELFAGAKFEEKFGHMVLCGLGGIFIEVLKDVNSGLAPLTTDEALAMIRSLKGYKILKGARGQQAVSEDKLAEVVVRLSALVTAAPEIFEMDLNPLLGKGDQVVAVDARIRIVK